MIKANELKPDNLIYFNNPLNNDDKRIVVIDSVKKSIGSFQEKHDHGIDIWLPLISCDGIPLTPEWLERCGFEAREEPDEPLIYSILKMDLDICLSDDGYYLYTNNSDPWHNTKVGRKIEYVHQIQNIYLDLTGEELNLN